ncbi:MAG: NUDIX hydrolase [Pseudobdellovibrionaceae bacterium]|jgi:8-oxo-dGTP pyrophosphatase MutT (NUDIX family)|nr:NUDIX hydrolase [Pseudobdellovibrionaceae bacterium]
METIQSFASAVRVAEPETDRVFTFIVDKRTGLCLAQLRSDDGTWSLTGGLVDPGETPQEALLRECFEEIGFIPSDIKEIYGSVVKNDRGEDKYCRIFLATIEDAKTLTFSPCPIEVTELRWVPHTDWPEPPHPEMLKLLKNRKIISYLRPYTLSSHITLGSSASGLSSRHP